MPMYLSFLAVIVQPLIGIMRSRSARIVVWPVIDPKSHTVKDDPYSLTSTSTKSFLGALAVNGAFLAAAITAFTFMRRYFRHVYEPRSLSFFDVCAFKFSSPSGHGMR